MLLNFWKKEREKEVELVVLRPGLYNIKKGRDVDRKHFCQNYHGARSLLDTLSYTFDLQSFDTVVIYSNRLLGHIEQALLDTHPYNSSTLNSGSNKSNDRDFYVLRHLERLNKRFVVASKAYQQAINIRNTGKILVVCEFAEEDTEAAIIPQAIGRFRDFENADITAAVYEVRSDKDIYYPTNLQSQLTSFYYNIIGDRDLANRKELKYHIDHIENLRNRRYTIEGAIELDVQIAKSITKISAEMNTFVKTAVKFADYIKPISQDDYITNRYREKYKNTSTETILDAISHPFAFTPILGDSGGWVDFELDYSDKLKRLAVSSASGYRVDVSSEEFNTTRLETHCEQLGFKGSKEIVDALISVLKEPDRFKMQRDYINEVITRASSLSNKFKDAICWTGVKMRRLSSILQDYSLATQGWGVKEVEDGYSNSQLEKTVELLIDISIYSSTSSDISRDRVRKEKDLNGYFQRQYVRNYSSHLKKLESFRGLVEIKKRVDNIGEEIYGVLEKRCKRAVRSLDSIDRWIKNIDLKAFKTHGADVLDRISAFLNYMSQVNEILRFRTYIGAQDRVSESKLSRDLSGNYYSLDYLPLLLKDRGVDQKLYIPNCSDKLLVGTTLDFNNIKKKLFEKSLWEISYDVDRELCKISGKLSKDTSKEITCVRELDGPVYETSTREFFRDGDWSSYWEYQYVGEKRGVKEGKVARHLRQAI